jgi:hypothetical protein
MEDIVLAQLLDKHLISWIQALSKLVEDRQEDIILTYLVEHIVCLVLMGHPEEVMEEAQQEPAQVDMGQLVEAELVDIPVLVVMVEMTMKPQVMLALEAVGLVVGLQTIPHM